MKVVFAADLVLNLTRWTYTGRVVSGLGGTRKPTNTSLVRRVASCEQGRYDERWVTAMGTSASSGNAVDTMEDIGDSSRANAAARRAAAAAATASESEIPVPKVTEKSSSSISSSSSSLQVLHIQFLFRWKRQRRSQLRLGKLDVDSAGSVAKKVRRQVLVESKSVTPRSPQLLPDAKKCRENKVTSPDGDQLMDIKRTILVKSIS